MTKRNGKKDTEEKDRRRIVKAQALLQRAQEKRAEAVARGKEEIEGARARAEARIAKATRRVENASTALAEAEARLASHRPVAALYVRAEPPTPEAVAEALEEEEDRLEAEHAEPAVIVPEGMETEAPAAPTPQPEPDRLW